MRCFPYVHVYHLITCLQFSLKKNPNHSKELCWQVIKLKILTLNKSPKNRLACDIDTWTSLYKIFKEWRTDNTMLKAPFDEQQVKMQHTIWLLPSLCYSLHVHCCFQGSPQIYTARLMAPLIFKFCIIQWYLRPVRGCTSGGCVSVPAMVAGLCCLGLLTLVLLLANSSLIVWGRSGSNLTPCCKRENQTMWWW